jgi:hypothetical protein
MTSPEPGNPSTGIPPGRERLVGLLVLGVAVVLLLSSVTWFSSDRAGVGIGQLALGLVLAGVGGFLIRRTRPH